MPPPPSPRWLYLHGFGSNPESKKGVALSARFAASKGASAGITLERLDLRVPSAERLLLSSMIATTRTAIGGERDRAILIGSSLGGLTAARVAEADPRVCALVLLAPAFRLTARWKERLGEEGLSRWQEEEWLALPDDAARGGPARMHVDFLRNAEALDDRLGFFPDVRIPTLVIHGRLDDVVSIEVSREFAQGRRLVRLVEVDDGHELVASLPRIGDEIESFLHL